MEGYQSEVAPEPAASEKPGSGFVRIIVDILEVLVLSVLLFLGINAVSARIRVDGFSMEPTMHNGEFVLVNKMAYKLGSPNIGDVIVFRYPRDPAQEYIKRVIGLPGDQIKVLNGLVYVNGKPLSEPYIASKPAYQTEWTVPQDSLFVLGDNRNNSSDSHSWGPLPLENVVGKALVVYWPPTQWGVLQAPKTASAAP